MKNRLPKIKPNDPMDFATYIDFHNGKDGWKTCHRSWYVTARRAHLMHPKPKLPNERRGPNWSFDWYVYGIRPDAEAFMR